jgi:hypothetical protein
MCSAVSLSLSDNRDKSLSVHDSKLYVFNVFPNDLKTAGRVTDESSTIVLYRGLKGLTTFVQGSKI